MSRERQLWKPIFTLASYFGMLNGIIPYAIATMEDKRLEDVATSKELHLLEALNELVTETRFYTVAEIQTKMGELYPESLKWLTRDWIGRTLSRQFGFKRRGKRRSSRAWLLDPKTIYNLCVKYGVEVQTSLTP